MKRLTFGIWFVAVFVLGMIAGERLGKHKMQDRTNRCEKAFNSCYDLLMPLLDNQREQMRQQDKPTNL